MNIRARSAAPLRVGGRSTIDRPDGLCALTVEEIYRLAGGRWNAPCRVSDPVWL